MGKNNTSEKNMRITEELLVFMSVIGLIYGRELYVEFDGTTCRKVILGNSYTVKDFLVMWLEYEDAEVVKVHNYKVDLEGCVITFEGDSVGDNIKKHYRVMLADY